ncbi:MAG: MarR family transcriptional regulator [Chloroflexota bacterium]|nr:MarR family transcriptional regulator [Chloroflexota bacterium]MDE2856897.1 MarR family transcriptional regulator [Chloroflexota bacterium]
MNKCDVSGSANAQPFEEEFFLLLMRINRVLRQLANQQMEICSLTPTQLFFLKRLYEAGAPQPISFFADGVFSNRSNATQMIDRLQAEGYVERVKNPKDRRSVLVQLTASGAQELEAGHARHQQLAQALFAPFSDQERDAAIRTLRRVLSLLEAYQSGGSDGLEDAQANRA